MNISADVIFSQAHEAAQKAAIAVNAELPPEEKRGFDCGFAWVVIKPARGKFVAWLKAHGKGDPHYYGGWNLWYSLFSIDTQSIDVHKAAAIAFAQKLVEFGINAEPDWRLD